MAVIYNYRLIPGAALAVPAAGAFCRLQGREACWGQGLCAVGKAAGRTGQGQAGGRGLYSRGDLRTWGIDTTECPPSPVPCDHAPG